MPHRVLPYVVLTPVTEEQEGEAALLALVGHKCVLCGKNLARSAGYICCALPYCPLCGKAVWACGHCVALKRRTVTLLNRRYAGLGVVETPDFKQTPKRYRLAEQAGQVVLVFDTDFAPRNDVMKEKKRWKHEVNLLHRHLLETALLPDIRTAHQSSSGRYTYYYFSHDPDAARARVLRVATERINYRDHS